MHHLLFFFISLSLSLSLSSIEEFDKNFLESLPEETRERLIKENAEKEKLREIEYRRPSSSMKKPDKISSRFGSNLFSMMQSTFMPLNEPNVDGSYVLDYGDVLQLQMVGTESSITRLNIKRNGAVIIKDVGEVNISGLSLTQAVELIKVKVEQAFTGAKAFVTLEKIRDIQVLLVGEVYNPGTYTLSGNSNILHALNVSGGPSDSGSFRRITLSRSNKIIEEVDLYKTYILGKSPSATRIMSGDVIFIHQAINIVTVSGAVKRPGQYELKEKENLGQAIQYANGLSTLANSTDINLERFLEGGVVTERFGRLSDLNKILSEPGDVIYIAKNDYIDVKISGYVERPGTYAIKEGSGLLELLNRSGGYKTNAYPLGGIYLNQEALENSKKAREELSRRRIDALRKASFNSKFPDASTLNAESLVAFDTAITLGRLEAEFDIDVLVKDPSKDLKFQDGDQIIIPPFINQVYIYGAVGNGGTTKFIPGKGVNYYLNKRGSFLESADRKNLIIMNPNGLISPVKYKRRFLSQRIFEDTTIYPGSIILVPAEVTTNNDRLLIVDAYASILSNIGISLASLNILAD